MIKVFHASQKLKTQFARADDERALISMIVKHLTEYQLVTYVKHGELDIAFAATGGPSPWVYGDTLAVACEPELARSSEYGDILVEQANGYVNLSTPAGFIPLVDVEEKQGSLSLKTYN